MRDTRIKDLERVLSMHPRIFGTFVTFAIPEDKP